MYLFFPRVKQTITTTGTAGSYDLSGGVTLPTYITFDAAGAVGNSARNDTYTVFYSMDNGVDFEVGVGDFAQATQIVTRSAVIASSNANAAVNWTAGDKTFALIDFGSGALGIDGSTAVDFTQMPAIVGTHALCLGSQSSNNRSTAAGYAAGTHSVSLKARAAGLSAFAAANGAANGDYSIVIGDGATDGSGQNNIVLGFSASAPFGGHAVAIGQAASVSSGAVALGQNATVNNNNGVALGRNALGWMPDAVAFGPGYTDAGAVGMGGALVPLYLNKTSAAGTSEVLKTPTGNTSPILDETTTFYSAFAVLYGKIIGQNSTDFKVFDLVIPFQRVFGSGTSLLGTPTITAGTASAGASSWTAAVAVNGTAIDISVDAAASKWTGTLTLAWSNS